MFTPVFRMFRPLLLSEMVVGAFDGKALAVLLVLALVVLGLAGVAFFLLASSVQRNFSEYAADPEASTKNYDKLLLRIGLAVAAFGLLYKFME